MQIFAGRGWQAAIAACRDGWKAAIAACRDGWKAAIAACRDRRDGPRLTKVIVMI
jgi:hypothetical protein